MTEREIIDEFLRAMRAEGVEVDSAIIADGRRHRAHVVGDRPKDKAVTYILHTDGRPNGVFWAHRLHPGLKLTWKAEAGAVERMTAEQRRAASAARRAAREAAEARIQAEYDAAAARAMDVYERAREADTHPYATRKGVKLYPGLRVGAWEHVDDETGEIRVISDNALLIPIRNTRKELRSLEAILPKKQLGGRDKDFLKAGEKGGCFFTIGRPNPDAMVFVFVEGYATGASIHEATGHCIVLCFDAGNLLPVARQFRERYPEATLLFAADSDLWSNFDADGRPKNVGVTRAREAAMALSGLVAIPHFEDVATKPTDFNDLHRLEDLDAVRAQIERALQPPAPAPAPEPPPPAPPPEEEETSQAEDEGEPETDNSSSSAAQQAAAGYFAILGYDHEKFYAFQHEKRQVMMFTQGSLNENGLIMLAPLQWWEMNFPGENGGMSKKAAVNWFVREAYDRGIYDPSNIRGRGAWLDAGRNVVHLGSALSVNGAETDVTRINSKFVYELARSLPRPAETALTDEEGRHLLKVASRFRWTKPASAALLSGWVALAPLCGAMRWRPHIWLTGGAGSGKSTCLNGYVAALTKGWHLFAQGNSTEAGIRQRLRGDALPILIDESESNEEADAKRIQGILSLLRQASTESAAETMKGTTHGEAMRFHIRSMGCLASIQVALKHQADMERLTVLAFRPKREAEGDETWAVLKEDLYLIERDDTIASRLMRRAIDLLPITLRNIEIFADAAARKFGTHREGDQYGTLMAGAWSLMNSGLATPEQAAKLIDSFDWSEHLEHADSDGADRALGALMEAHIRADGGAVLSVAELAQRAAGLEVSGLKIEPHIALAILERHGMKIRSGDPVLPPGNWLMISNTSLELRKLMAGTPYEADLRGHLLRVDGVIRYGDGRKTIKFCGYNSKCVAVPIAKIAADPLDRF